MTVGKSSLSEYRHDVRTDADEISGNQGVSLDLLPFPVTVGLDGVGLN